MVPAAVAWKRSKTLSIIVLAVATIVAAIWFVPRGTREVAVPDPRPTPRKFAEPPPGDPCAMTMTSRLTSTYVMAGERDEHLVVSVRAPNCGENQVRSPTSIAIILDRSRSMAEDPVPVANQPLTHAKRAVMELVDQLEPTDAFTIITYSDGAQVLTPMLHATPDAKLAARRAVAAVAGEGNTNIGAGLDLAAAQVVRSPIFDGLRRLVLVSDGNANTGEFSQDGLARIAANIARDGTSITSVGLGMQYSEAKMRSISAAGRGNYYFVEDATQLASIFTAELGSVGKVVAVNARLELSPSDNLEILEVFSYGARQDGAGWSVPLVDLAAGDTRKIVARVRVKAPRPGAIELATAELTYRPVDAHQERRLTSVASVEVTNDVAAVRAGIDTNTVTLVQEAETARAIDEATEAYARDGYAGAQQVLDRQMQHANAVAADLDAPGVAASSAAAVEKVREGFAAPPTAGGGGKAIKEASEAAYGLAK